MFTVVRQFSHKPDEPVCRHRWEWLAEPCAHFRERSHPDETGIHYTVRKGWID